MNQREIIENMFNTACVIIKKSKDYGFDTVENMSDTTKSMIYDQLESTSNLPRTTIRRIVNQYIKRENVTDLVNELAENVK